MNRRAASRDNLEILWYQLSIFFLRWTMPPSIRLAAYKGEIEMLGQAYPLTKADKTLLQQNYRIALKETS